MRFGDFLGVGGWDFLGCCGSGKAVCGGRKVAIFLGKSQFSAAEAEIRCAEADFSVAEAENRCAEAEK